VFGVVAVTNAFLPALRRSAHPRIVNVSSGTGSLTWSTGPNPQFDYQAAGTGSGAAYRSSKTSLDALTVFYAQALADDRFKVNALAPGLRATNLNPRAARPAATQLTRRRAPSGSRYCPTTAPPASFSPGTGRSCRGERRRPRLTPHIPRELLRSVRSSLWESRAGAPGASGRAGQRRSLWSVASTVMLVSRS
jgi:NAD(P)-dependent dehydrogenase (short-subunit alcohol dehydrogenase family)